MDCPSIKSVIRNAAPDTTQESAFQMERFITLVEPKVLQVTVVEVTGLVSGHYPYVQAVAHDSC